MSMEQGAADVNATFQEELFPRGPVELVDHFVLKGNEELIKYMVESEQWKNLGMAAKIRTAVKFRLMHIAPVVKTWPQAMALGAQPQNLANTLTTVAAMADSIWVYAGEKAEQSNNKTEQNITCR